MSTPQWDLPSSLLLIKTPFLLSRFVFFALQIYLNLNALVFAIWNVGASRAAGVHVGGASTFIIFNGITTTLCIASALMDMKISFISTSMIGFECMWTSIFMALQIAASTFVTLSGPPEFCDTKAAISVCASFTILVPISWLASTLLLSYFVAISTLCITHLRVYPTLWFTSIYTIVWFIDDGAADKRSSQSAPQIPPLETCGPTRLSVFSRRHSTSSIPRDVENQLSDGPDVEKPLPSSPTPSNVWWGRLLPGRPGRDHPFRFRRARGVEFKWWPGESENDEQGTGVSNSDIDPPKYPGSQPQTPAAGESRFLPYPPASLDENEPIPVDNRSQWVHAEQALRA